MNAATPSAFADLIVGPGQAAFSSTPLLSVLNIVLADLNGDGRQDLVFLGSAERSAQVTTPFVVLNDGSAQPFAAVEPQPLGTAATYTSLQIADLNGDGRPDIVAPARSGPSKVFLNSGSVAAPTFQAEDLIAGSGSTQSAAVADVNADGYLDLVLGNSVLDSIAETSNVYLNNATLQPFHDVAPRPVGTGGLKVMGTQIADVDSDGRADVLLLSVADSDWGLRAYLNNGTADPFADVSATLLVPFTAAPAGFRARDLNADGRPDIVVTWGAGTWQVYLHTGTSTAPFSTPMTLQHRRGISDACSSVSADDINGDGKVDIAIGCLGPQPPFFTQPAYSGGVYLNDGSATPFSQAQLIEIRSSDNYSSDIRSLAVGDLGGTRTLLIDVDTFGTGPATLKAHALIEDKLPVAMNDAVSVIKTGQATIDILANDTDADGRIVRTSIWVRAIPQHGRISIDPTTQAVAYTADDFVGTDTFQYSVDDDIGGTSNVATVTVDIKGKGGGGGSADPLLLVGLLGLAALLSVAVTTPGRGESTIHRRSARS